MQKHIANTITLTSLCIAILAIIEACNFNFTICAYLILICVFLDGIDGLVARYFKSCSEFGKQLDGLSDMIAFGIAPSILMYNFIYLEINPNIIYIALLTPIASAIRLAQYNSTNKQTSYFIGLTTPANAILLVSIPLIKQYEENEILLNIILNPYFIIGIIIISSTLLITKLKTFELRLDNLKNNKRKLFFIFISIYIFSIFKFTALLIIIPLYIILSVIKIIE